MFWAGEPLTQVVDTLLGKVAWGVSEVNRVFRQNYFCSSKHWFLLSLAQGFHFPPSFFKIIYLF